MEKRNKSFRNFVAKSPLLRKGGAHRQSKTGQRVKIRQSLNSEINEWFVELEDHSQKDKKGSKSSPFYWVYIIKLLTVLSAQSNFKAITNN